MKSKQRFALMLVMTIITTLTMATTTRAATTSEVTALFIGAHQDDETLIMGGGIINHLANTANNVYYSCITDGRSSGLNNPALPPYLTSDQFVAARNAEKNNSLARMGLLPGHQLYASQGVMADGTLNTDPLLSSTNAGYNGNDITAAHVNMGIVSRIRNLLQQVSAATGVPTTSIAVKTHTHMDPHPDHRAISQAAMYLQSTGEIGTNCLRQYISPQTWSGPASYAGTVFSAASTLNPGVETPAASGKFVDALLEFVKTSSSCGGYAGYATYGIGYVSVTSMFDNVMSHRYSMYHVPVAPVYN